MINEKSITSYWFPSLSKLCISKKIALKLKGHTRLPNSFKGLELISSFHKKKLDASFKGLS